MRRLILPLFLAASLLMPWNADARLSLLGLKNSLVQFALQRINVPGSLEITVEGVERDEDGATELVGVAVADGTGVWLRIERVGVGWTPSRLLRGELAITRLAATNVQVLRQPRPGPEEPAAAAAEEDGGPVQIRWPRAPLTVSVDGLRFNNVTVAAGVLGGRPLAFDAEGSLRDERNDQTATFNLTRTDDVAGEIRLDYHRDFAAETLRLNLDAREAPGGLVAGLAGLPPGSAAEVQVTGDGPVLNWRGDLRADIGNLGRLDGQINVPSVQPAHVRLDVRAAAQGELQAAAQPLLDRPVDLVADVQAEPSGLVTLNTLEVKGDLGSAAAAGTFDANAGRLDLTVDASIPKAGEPLLPAATAEGLRFRGAVNGLIEDLKAAGKLEIASYDRAAASAAGVAIDGSVGIRPGSISFAVDGSAAALRADRLILTDGAPVTLGAAGTLAGDRFTLERAEVAGPLLTASASGEANLADGPVSLSYRAAAADLTPIAAAYGTDASGAFLVEGRVSGPLSGPMVKGTANLQRLTLDGQAMGDIGLTHDVTLAEEISGTADIRAETEPYGRLTADTAFRLAGERLTLSTLTASGLGVQASGKGPLTIDLANTLASGRLNWRAASLEPLGRFAGTPLAGSGSGNVVLSTPDGRQAADITADIAGLRSGGAAVDRLKLKAALRNLLADAPGVRATVTAGGIATGGVKVPEATVNASGTLAALDVKAALAGKAPDGKPFAADMTARMHLAGEAQTARIARLEATYAGQKARLTKPLTVTVRGSSVEAAGLALAVPGGTVAGNAALSGNRLRGSADIALADIGPLARLAGLPLESGSLKATAKFDTQRSATLQATVRDLVADDLPADAGGINADLTGEWDGREARASATVAGGFGNPAAVTAAVGLRPSGGLFPQPRPTAPLRGTVKWAGRIEPLWALVPAPDHYLAGQADIDLIIGGTVAAPQLSGKASLRDGRYENLEIGTILTNLEADSSVAADGGFVVTMTGNDGGQAPVTARIAVSGGQIDARVETRQATLVRRPDLEAIVTADIAATGPMLAPDVKGDVLVNRAEVRLVHAVPPNIATLGEVRIKGEPEPEERQAREQRDSPIGLDLRIHAPRNIFVRGRGLDSEWEMDLKVAGNTSRPRVTGSIDKIRGQLALLGRNFNLDTGRVAFSGAIPVDPDIDVKLFRENDGIRGGVAVSGRASDIEVDFVSTPTLPRGEVMPRLLFGRSRQSLSGVEALQLASGIATLLDGSGGTIDQVRSAVGLDVLRMEGEGDGTSVMLGRNIDDDVFVGVNQPLDGSAPTFRVEIEVMDNIAVETDVGSQAETSVGVQWRRDF